MAVVAEFRKRVGDLKPLLVRIDGVVGVAVGGTSENPRIIVMVSRNDDKVRARIARVAGDIPREIVNTGEFKARPTMTHR